MRPPATAGPIGRGSRPAKVSLSILTASAWTASGSAISAASATPADHLRNVWDMGHLVGRRTAIRSRRRRRGCGASAPRTGDRGGNTAAAPGGSALLLLGLGLGLLVGALFRGSGRRGGGGGGAR